MTHLSKTYNIRVYQFTFGEGGASFWKALTVDLFGFLKQQKKEFSKPSSPSATKASVLFTEPVVVTRCDSNSLH